MSMDLMADSKASILTAALCSRYADRNVKAYLMTAIGRAPQVLGRPRRAAAGSGAVKRCRAVISGRPESQSGLIRRELHHEPVAIGAPDQVHRVECPAASSRQLVT